MTKQDVLGMYFKCADLDERTRLIEQLEGMGVHHWMGRKSHISHLLYVGVDKYDDTFVLESDDKSGYHFFNGTVTPASSFLAQFEPAINEHGDDFHAVPDELKTI